MKKKPPRISVVIVNHNGEEFVKDCFDCLHKTDYPTDLLEIICVDNASADGSPDIIKNKFPQVSLISNPINNYALANNLGIKTSTGKYVALLNNDTKVDQKGKQRSNENTCNRHCWFPRLSSC